jgi:predicted nuclease of predicted toxin-antitoxin system
VRFLADESCDFGVVRALRATAHEVLAVAELASGSDDAIVLDMACRQNRVLLTEDKDFGQLVYAHSQQSSGVIFIRYPASARKTLPNGVVGLVSELASDLMGSFVVMSPGRIRIGDSAKDCR